MTVARANRRLWGHHMTMEQFTHDIAFVGHFYPEGKTRSLEAFVSAERRYNACSKQHSRQHSSKENMY